MRFPKLAALAAAMTLAGAAGAHEFALGDLTIAHPYAIATPATAKTGAGYLSVTNGGREPDSLVAVRAAFPMVAVHRTETDAAGVARMVPVEALEIPPGATVTLEPGGTHVMFMGLTAPFAEGEKIDATLVFEKAGEIAVHFNVEARSEGTPEHEMDHGTTQDAPASGGSGG